MITQISLTVPDETAVAFAVPGGTPADQMSIPLMSVNIPNITVEQTRDLRVALQKVADRTKGVRARFPHDVVTMPDGHVVLTAEGEELEQLRGYIADELDRFGLGSYIESRTAMFDYCDTGLQGDPPASLTASALEPASSVFFAQLKMSTPTRSRVFTLGSDDSQTMDAMRAFTASSAVVGGGARFRIPLVVPEGVETGDKRIFEPLSLSVRNLPIPLLWQIKSASGHDGSVIIGRIDTINRVDNGLGDAYGVFDTGPYGREAQRLVETKMLRGVSADLDQFEAADDSDDEKSGKSKLMKIKKGRVMAVTAVARPAFQECFIEIVDDDPNTSDVEFTEPQEDDDMPDNESMVACAMIASSIPVTPPKSWLDNPRLREPSPLIVTDEGRVFGHVALWHQSHVGLPGNTKPPRSRSNYAYFKSGTLRTEEGEDIDVGQLTLTGGHADLALSARDAVAHYDNTDSAVADITAGEDAFGIWVAGALRPGVTPEQIRTLRASAPSGDWRPINGRLELVAICQVNSPGFPVARTRVASGYVTALVAAGASAVAQLKGPSVSERISKLEKSADMQFTSARVAELSARVNAVTTELTEESLFRNYSAEKRAEYAKEGIAMPEGQYPIATKTDVKNAIRAFGRCAPDQKAATKKHIIKRARKLGALDLIPDTWSAQVVEMGIEEQKLRMASLTAALDFRRRAFDPELHPRDEEGQFREKIARLRDEVIAADVGEEAGAKLIEAEKAVIEGRREDAAAAIDDVEHVIARREEDLIPHVPSLQEGNREAGKAIGNFEFPVLETGEKYRFTDLPPAVKDSIDSLMRKVEANLTEETAADVLLNLREFISGNDLMHTSQVQAEIARLVAALLGVGPNVSTDKKKK